MVASVAAPYEPAEIVTGAEARKLTGLSYHQIHRLAQKGAVSVLTIPGCDPRYVPVGICSPS